VGPTKVFQAGILKTA